MGGLVNGRDPQVTPVVARQVYESVVGNHSTYLVSLEKAILDQREKQVIAYDAVVKRNFDLWVIAAKTPIKMIPTAGAPAESAIDALLLQSSDFIKSRVLTDRTGLAQQQASWDKGFLREKFADIAIRRGFVDGLYTDGKFGSSSDLGLAGESPLDFLDENGEVLAESKMTPDQMINYAEFRRTRYMAELEFLMRPPVARLW